MPGDSTPQHAPSDASNAFQDLNISDERRLLLAPILEALLVELVKIREIEPIDGEPATPWPWKEASLVR